MHSALHHRSISGRFSGRFSGLSLASLIPAFTPSDPLDSQSQWEGSPLVVRWSPSRPSSGHPLVGAGESGEISVWLETQSGLRHAQRWLAHNNAIFDLAWAPFKNSVIAAASADQTISLWDLQSGAPTALTYCRHHTGTVKSVMFSDSNVFASAGRDGCIAVWDIRTPQSPMYSVGHAHSLMKNRRRVPSSVTSVVWLSPTVLASGGAADGLVKLWDVRKAKKGKLGTVGSIPTTSRGISSLSVSPSGSQLLVNCTDSKLYLHNVSSRRCAHVFSGHRVGSFYVKAGFSPCGKFCASGSSDGNVYIWDVAKAGSRPYCIGGSLDEVCGVEWNPFDFSTLATYGDRVTVWRMKQKPVPTSPKEMRTSSKIQDGGIRLPVERAKRRLLFEADSPPPSKRAFFD